MEITDAAWNFEAFQLVAGVPTEDLPADVLIVHPLKEKISAETPWNTLPQAPQSTDVVYLRETLARH